MDSDIQEKPADVAKQRAQKKFSELIQKFYHQLTKGCGRSSCDNPDCFSAGRMSPLTPDQAAVRAVDLLRNHARLCSSSPHKSAEDPDFKTQEWTNDERMKKCIHACETAGDYRLLRHYLGRIFSDPARVNQSFLLEDGYRGEPLDEWRLRLDVPALRRCYEMLKPLMEEVSPVLVNAFIQMFSCAETDLATRHWEEMAPEDINMFPIAVELMDLVEEEASQLEIMRYLCRAHRKLRYRGMVYLCRTLVKACDAARLESVVSKVHRHIAHSVSNEFISSPDGAQEGVIFLRVLYCASLLGGEIEKPLPCQAEEVIERKNAGIVSLSDLIDTAQGSSRSRDALRGTKVLTNSSEDPLFLALDLEPLYVYKPVVPLMKFYNQELSVALPVEKDFMEYNEVSDGPFPPFSALRRFDRNMFRFTAVPASEKLLQIFLAFLRYPFVLTPMVKSTGLFYLHRFQMLQQRYYNTIAAVHIGQMPTPFLKLRVNRKTLIQDALQELEMVAYSDPTALSKQLVVQFIGEQGVDEGGLSKEFFQLVVEEIFHPNYALFTLNKETNTHWLNSSSMESPGHYKLIGLVIGLAIYNNVILDVHFPTVIYKKLMGKTATFHDLEDFDPTFLESNFIVPQVLYRSLCSLLDYNQPDVEDVYEQTFEIAVRDCFGEFQKKCLKPGGDKIRVNHENKLEFVKMYADYLLNWSVEQQFSAFKKGFLMVTQQSEVFSWFTPGEVELLVCGTVETDLTELESFTKYDCGYSADSEVIRWFWKAVHEMTSEQKLDLLRFITGSHRVPVGGLKALGLVISRHGDDSSRLPSAHTCFNVLLLPGYASEELLRERIQCDFVADGVEEIFVDDLGDFCAQRRVAMIVRWI
ncbi:unnamed protein product [Notodromas monacha]|uniref:HECT-type E3 ubiquitin transferase n=1 Tax=Notodromas monacha TaxID=399045 RepID=A0A7R9BUI7_9CRUS|nr:unnamed protein product [Notodromas monacha]CAG0922014.1 unnamed protein product [Notodromas monacha]